MKTAGTEIQLEARLEAIRKAFELVSNDSKVKFLSHGKDSWLFPWLEKVCKHKNLKFPISIMRQFSVDRTPELSEELLSALNKFQIDASTHSNILSLPYTVSLFKKYNLQTVTAEEKLSKCLRIAKSVADGLRESHPIEDDLQETFIGMMSTALKKGNDSGINVIFSLFHACINSTYKLCEQL